MVSEKIYKVKLKGENDEVTIKATSHTENSDYISFYFEDIFLASFNKDQVVVIYDAGEIDLR